MSDSTPRVEVVREPLTYERDAPQSYFRDLALGSNGDNQSSARLQRHAAEMRVELPRREQRVRARMADGLEYRNDPSRLQGQGGFGSPPLWLLDAAATAPRPGRVLGALIPHFPLPDGVSSVNLPRLTTGTQTSVPQDLAAVASRDIADALVTSPAAPIAGQGDVALQLLEQSPPGAHLDHAIFKDLSADYDAQLEALLINGTGTNGQFFGLLNIPSGPGLANAVTYTSASPTGSEIFPYFGQVAGQIGDARSAPQEIWLMRTARWAWLGVAEDGQRMPLAVPGHVAAPPIPYLFDDHRPAQGAPLLTFPIYPDDAIPATLGATNNQDAVIGCRPTDMMLLESGMHTSVMLDVLSGVLQARLQLHGYCAALLGRYPTGIGTLTGTGMVVQAGF